MTNGQGNYPSVDMVKEWEECSKDMPQIEKENAAKEARYQAKLNRAKADTIPALVAENLEMCAAVSGQPLWPPRKEETIDPRTYEKMTGEALSEAEPRYIVRGALMKCHYGSHHRRINLPEAHGVYIVGNPILSRTDRTSGTDEEDISIPPFGICQSPNSPPHPNIFLKKEAPRDKFGRIIGKSSEIITGPPCEPDVTHDIWHYTHDITRIDEAPAAPALTTDSCIICKYCGIIEFVTSGQEYSDGETEDGGGE